MRISEVIRKLQEEQRKYGDIEVVAHAPNHPALVLDIATFEGGDSFNGRVVWISTEEAE